MGMIIQISEESIDELSEGLENMLHVGGKMMSCVEKMRRGSSDMGYRGRGHMGYRDERENKDWDEMDWRNRRRDSEGRYM